MEINVGLTIPEIEALCDLTDRRIEELQRLVKDEIESRKNLNLLPSDERGEAERIGQKYIDSVIIRIQKTQTLKAKLELNLRG